MTELSDIENGLWTPGVDAQSYGTDIYSVHVLEQYKVCIQAAENISQRRGTANTFFLTFNTALVGALAALFEKIPPDAALAFYVAAALFCVAWGFLLRSYRLINSAKFKVIGLLEKRLPASPFWSAEWKALGEGKDWRKHIPLSPIETLMPMVFFMVYAYLGYLTVLKLTAAP